jgi:hypothetical protein
MLSCTHTLCFYLHFHDDAIVSYMDVIENFEDMDY